jgi:hypothetical protein
MPTRVLTPVAALALLVLAGCAGGMAGSGGAGAGAGAGAYEWPSGTEVTYEVAGAQTMTMEQPGMGSMSFTTTTSMEVVIEATSAQRQFSLSITDASISSDMEAMGQEMPDIKGLIGLESMITLDSRGLITEATNIENNPVISEQGGPGAFKESLQGLFLYMPEGGLGPAVEWDRAVNFTLDQSGLGVTVNSDDHFVCEERTTYEGVSAYRVTSTSIATMSGSGDQEGMAIDMDGSGEGESTMFVEVGTGKILSAEGTITISGGIYVEAAGMSIPFEMKMVNTVKPRK